MSLRALAPRPSTVRLADLREGDVLIPDRGHPCMEPHPRVVHVGERGPWVCCANGRHHLDGQLDAAGNVVGLRRYK